MPALGLQTYIWNNNIRSTVLLVGFPVLLLGMVFCLTLGMIWAGMLPPGEYYGGDVAEALSLMWHAAPLAITSVPRSTKRYSVLNETDGVIAYSRPAPAVQPLRT